MSDEKAEGQPNSELAEPAAIEATSQPSLTDGHSSDRLSSVLPKKFLADDPGFVDHSLRSQESKTVLLPDGAGGVTSVQKNVVRIEHNGEIIELTALSPEEKRRRQFWINISSIIIGITIITLFFWLLY